MKLSPSADIIGVAIVGYGTVGEAVVRLLRDEQGRSFARLHYVIDRDPNSIQLGNFPREYCLARPDQALSDPNVSVVVELIGGVEAARELCLQALCAGKHVVTANKALLAEHGEELFACARSHGVVVGFEASCCAGIPIIRALYSGLIANRIEAMYGIVNGTCNFILSEMFERQRSYAEALQRAQQLGLAEANPTLDVGGIDSAHKIALLATIGFGIGVNWHAIPVTGIDRLQQIDVSFGQRLGYTIKLLAIATNERDGVSLRVRPCFIDHSHPLAWVNGSFNAVSVYGHAVGHTLFYGRGAGGMPTASAIMADIVGIARGDIVQAFESFPFWPDRTTRHELVPVGDTTSRFYIRAMVADAPGVLAQIAAIFGHHTINIASVHQYEHPHYPAPNGVVPLVITLHPSSERRVSEAVQEIDRLSVVKENSVMIPIVDEHPEVGR